MAIPLSQIREINKLLLAYSAGSYHVKGRISPNLDEIDTIIAGVNMLGEELLETTISLDYFSSIYSSLSEMVFVVSANGTIRDANKSAAEHLKLRDLQGKPVNRFVKKEIPSFFHGLKEKLSGGMASFTRETVFVAEGGRLIPVQCTCSRIMDKNNNFTGYLIVAEDITERKESEKTILRAIVEAQDREQQRVAIDLHDSLGQQLSTIKRLISAIRNNLKPAGGNYENALRSCEEFVDSSIDSIRSICFNIMPSSIAKGGIREALMQLAARQTQHDSLGISVSVPDRIPEITKSLELALYRIAQEFISNSIKHSEANHIALELVFDKEWMVFRLKDNGKGFIVDEVKNQSGLGMNTMRSRVQAFSGKFNFNSKPGYGTKLEVRFKLTD